MMQCPNDFPVPLITVEQTNSTNSYLREHCQLQLPEAFTTVVASFQTAGRGQRGNHWESEAGQNLLFSFILYPSFLEARRQFLLSQILSLSIKEVLDSYAEGISIKWPNDIYWQEKKICGMLIENELTGIRISQSIAGIGININQREFHSSAPNPVSLHQITGREHNCFEILNQIMNRTKEYYALLQAEEASLIATRYQEALFRKKGMHRYHDANGTFRAEITRVDPEGMLILTDEADKERTYAFKEVQYLLG